MSLLRRGFKDCGFRPWVYSVLSLSPGEASCHVRKIALQRYSQDEGLSKVCKQPLNDLGSGSLLTESSHENTAPERQLQPHKRT